MSAPKSCYEPIPYREKVVTAAGVGELTRVDTNAERFFHGQAEALSPKPAQTTGPCKKKVAHAGPSVGFHFFWEGTQAEF